MDNKRKISNSSENAIYSLLGKSIRVVSGPLSLVFISEYLSIEEIAFYYTFVSIIATQQLLELGVGYVLKQNISHSLSNINDGNLKTEYYIKFSFFWFLILALFMLIIVAPLGAYYLNSLDNNNISWGLPWVALICASTYSILTQPASFVLEGLQRQTVVFKTQIISGIFGTIFLCVSLLVGGGIYSISISVLSIAIVNSIRLIPIIKSEMRNVANGFFLAWSEFVLVFKEVWPLLSRVSLVWGAGYFFWNSFSLIAMKVLPASEAGKVLFTLAVGRAGFSIANSVMQSQSTYLSNLIASNKIKMSIRTHRKYSFLSMAVGSFGYSAFLLIYYKYEHFDFFYKFESVELTGVIFLYYMLVLFQSNLNEYLRCYKVEPFVNVTIFNALVIPLIFYIFLYDNVNYAFLGCCVVMVWSIIVCLSIRIKFLRNKFG